jgi:hypothetical protein
LTASPDVPTLFQIDGEARFDLARKESAPSNPLLTVELLSMLAEEHIIDSVV